MALHSLCEESCVEQVHACVLSAADVLVNRAELVDLLLGEHLLIVLVVLSVSTS